METPSAKLTVSCLPGTLKRIESVSTTSFYFLFGLLSWQPDLQPGPSPVPAGFWPSTRTCALRVMFCQAASLQVLQLFICETAQAPPFPPFYGPEAEESVCKPAEQARIC